MSRRRSTAYVYDVRVRIVCTGNGSHETNRLGTLEWNSESDPRLPGKVQARLNGSSHKFRPRTTREFGEQHGFAWTVTFICDRCGRNVPMERSKWQGSLIATQKVGTTELDVSRLRA